MLNVRRILPVLVVCAAFFLLEGCARYTRVRPVSFKVESLSPKGLRSADVVLSVGVDNPAGEIRIYDVYGEAELFGKVIGMLATDPLVLEAKTNGTYRVGASVSLEGNFTILNALQIARDQESLDNMTVNIYATVKMKGLAPRKLKFEDIPVKELVKLL